MQLSLPCLSFRLRSVAFVTLLSLSCSGDCETIDELSELQLGQGPPPRFAGGGLSRLSPGGFAGPSPSPDGSFGVLGTVPPFASLAPFARFAGGGSVEPLKVPEPRQISPISPVPSPVAPVAPVALVAAARVGDDSGHFLYPTPQVAPPVPSAPLSSLPSWENKIRRDRRDVQADLQADPESRFAGGAAFQPTMPSQPRSGHAEALWPSIAGAVGAGARSEGSPEFAEFDHQNDHQNDQMQVWRGGISRNGGTHGSEVHEVHRLANRREAFANGAARFAGGGTRRSMAPTMSSNTLDGFEQHFSQYGAPERSHERSHGDSVPSVPSVPSVFDPLKLRESSPSLPREFSRSDLERTESASPSSSWESSSPKSHPFHPFDPFDPFDPSPKWPESTEQSRLSSVKDESADKFESWSMDCGTTIVQPKQWHFNFRPPNLGDFNIPIIVHRNPDQKSYQIAKMEVSVSAPLDNWQPFELRLISPSRTSILLKESGTSECADLHCDFTEISSCHSCTRPKESLSAFTGKSALGTWILSFEDSEGRKRSNAMAWAALKITWSCDPPLPQEQTP